MIRKQARQRRDYLYRKAAALKESETADKRAKLRDALASGKPLDPTIAKDQTLRKDYQYDESRDVNGDAALDLDDEYSATSGLSDPRVLVTTSRDPSSRLSAFSKEIRLLLPTSIRLNRGNQILPDIVSSAQSNGLSDIVMLGEHRGTPTSLVVAHQPHGPVVSFSLHNVRMMHDFKRQGSLSESYPHLIFEGFTTPLGKRICKALQHIFPPREPISNRNKIGNRVVTFQKTDSDCIEVRHHVFLKTSYDQVELSEVGPRMTMKPFEIRGGGLHEEGDVEWHLSQYTRTGRKKTYL